MGYAKATLKGTYEKPNGAPAEGWVDITPNSPFIVDGGGDVILVGPINRLPLDSTGSFRVDLPATDDTSVEPPIGRQYAVKVTFKHTAPILVSGVELPTGATVDMDDVTAAPETNPVFSTWLTEADYNALVARVTFLETSGVGGGGGGGLAAVDNGDGTFTLSGSTVTDNGDGTFTAA